MLVTINYTQNALEHFPDILQPVFKYGSAELPIGSRIEITEASYNALVSATYPHPDNNLPCRYFTIVVHSIETEQQVDPLVTLLLDEIKLYKAIYLQLKSKLDSQDLTDSDFAAAANVLYTTISNKELPDVNSDKTPIV